MPNDLHHVAVFVENLDRALNLFRDFFGFEIAWRLPKVGRNGLGDVMGLPGVEAEIAYLRSGSGGADLELARIARTSSEKEPAGKNGAPRVIVSLEVKDLDGLYQRLMEAGWTPFTQAVNLKSPEGGPIRMFCFEVENGLTVELFESSTTAAN
jgi:catechol 2,3-dioxygenase-like lactoylglutathione lyase family enzyme